MRKRFFTANLRFASLAAAGSDTDSWENSKTREVVIERMTRRVLKADDTAESAEDIRVTSFNDNNGNNYCANETPLAGFTGTGSDPHYLTEAIRVDKGAKLEMSITNNGPNTVSVDVTLIGYELVP